MNLKAKIIFGNSPKRKYRNFKLNQHSGTKGVTIKIKSHKKRIHYPSKREEKLTDFSTKYQFILRFREKSNKNKNKNKKIERKELYPPGTVSFIRDEKAKTSHQVKILYQRPQSYFLLPLQQQSLDLHL